MSGAGPAADESGNLVFVTGNSAASTWTDNVPCTGTATGSVPTSVPCSNIQESVVKLKGDLTAVTGLFSPNALYGTFSPDTTQLDQTDKDLGSGGVLLVPRRGSAFFSANAGKDGRLFLLDRSGTGLRYLQLYVGGKCFCSPSYFTGPDGVARIVTSQGQVIQTFKIPATPLSPEGTSATVSAGQDRGFFTTVSCHGNGAQFGNCANTPIIWAVSRPTSSTSGVSLWAFSGSGGKRRLPASPRSGECGTLAKRRRQREHRSDSLEWAGLCRFLENPDDTQPWRNDDRRRCAACAGCGCGGRFAQRPF